MAPEVLVSPDNLTVECDKWSFGATLWELFNNGNNPLLGWDLDMVLSPTVHVSHIKMDIRDRQVWKIKAGIELGPSLSKVCVLCRSRSFTRTSSSCLRLSGPSWLI